MSTDRLDRLADDVAAIRADQTRLARAMAIVDRRQQEGFRAAAERDKSPPTWITNRLNLRDLVWALVVIGAIWRGDTAGLVGYLTGRASAPIVVSQPVPAPSVAPSSETSHE